MYWVLRNLVACNFSQNNLIRSNPQNHLRIHFLIAGICRNILGVVKCILGCN